jgi:hypothetical protein
MMRVETLASITASFLLIGCVVPVVPARQPSASASAQEWAHGDEAMEVITYEPPKNSGMSDLDVALAIGVILLGGAIIDAATSEPERTRHGRVIWEDRRSCSECQVLVRLEHDDELEWLDPIYCNANGFFTIVLQGEKAEWRIDHYEVRETIDGEDYVRTILDFEDHNEELYIVISE